MSFTHEKSRGSSFLAARNREFSSLVLLTFVFVVGLVLTYEGKSHRAPVFADIPESLSAHEETVNGRKVQLHADLINLNHINSGKEVVPYLATLELNADESRFIGDQIYHKVIADKRKIENVGSLGRILIDEKTLNNTPGLASVKARLERLKIAAAKRAAEQGNTRLDLVKWLRHVLKRGTQQSVLTVPLLNDIGSIKSGFIVRTPQEFRSALIVFSVLLAISFWGVHLWWRLRGFSGDQVILPTILGLCSLGFLMMFSLRDPLRDTLSFEDYSKGVAVGAIVTAFVTSINYYDWYYRLKSKISIDPLLTRGPIALAIGLSLALILFGSGPGSSDAKVNLTIGFTFQPSEVIKILICFFVAAYFSNQWELIQNLNERRFRLLSIPRIKDIWTLLICVCLVVGLFILQKDLGPALMMAGSFLILFAIVRRHLLLSIGGCAAIVGSYFLNYYVIKFSQVAADRFDIWLSPWDTKVSGGEQIVQSLWALATGGLSGTGLGLGDPRFAPAAHTDLILSSIGEELGFLGILLVFGLYGLLIQRFLRIAVSTPSSYSLLLTLSITAITGLQILFISAGVLGLIPLSGVVSPFLSFGSTSMVMSFFAVGVVLVISAHSGPVSSEMNKAFSLPIRALAWSLALLAVLVVGKVAWIQTVRADEFVTKSVLAPQPDEVVRDKNTERTYVGIRRYQDNPRLREVLKELPFGTVYDRNGVPMASSKWAEVEEHRPDYDRLGIVLDSVCKKNERCYPFGASTFFLLGDVTTRLNWTGLNNFIERDYEGVLRGFNDFQTVEKIEVKEVALARDERTGEPILDPVTNESRKTESVVPFPIVKRDYRELLPLLRYRYVPFNLDALRLRYRERSIHTSIDARLQMELTRIVSTTLAAKGLDKAAAVVLDPGNGDLLAEVSYPIPSEVIMSNATTARENDSGDASELFIDRARWKPYPPGSTFKLVVEMAALNQDPNAFARSFTCQRLEDGRVGNYVRGTPIRDDVTDKQPHGTIAFREGLVNSCNAYFAQLGETVGADAISKTAERFNIQVGRYYPQSAFGQGEVVATPFQVAKVVSAIANDGTMTAGRWVIDNNNLRQDPAQRVVGVEQARLISEAMRGVVTQGTASRSFHGFPVQVAGKTGTAQNIRRENGEYVNARPHSWFVGFAPYDRDRRIAFAVVVENGGYGGTIAADISKQLIEACRTFGIIQ